MPLPRNPLGQPNTPKEVSPEVSPELSNETTYDYEEPQMPLDMQAYSPIPKSVQAPVNEPTPAYTPEPTYAAPEPTYAAPEPTYAAPEPVPTYNETPPENYPTPAYNTTIEENEENVFYEEDLQTENGYSPKILESVRLLLGIIADDESTEVIMNGPNEIMFKKAGARFHVPSINFEDVETYHNIINDYVLSLTDTEARINENSYLVEGQLELQGQPGEPPLLARVHIVAPPVVKYAKVTIAKKARTSYNLDDLAARGAMTPEMAEFLKAAAYGRLTTVFSGLSGAGKTTMLEAASHEFDQNDRIVVVEDTPELRLPIADVVYMTTSSIKPGTQTKDIISMEWLVKATNRMRPDRIIVGEVRGGEMSEFLVAANSGADGSMTTIHASDPRRTLDKILGLAMRAEGAKNEMSVRRDIASTIQLIVQLILVDGKHIVSHIEEISPVIRQDSGIIATTTLFEYDRSTGKHHPRSRPSDAMQAFLSQRGVEIQNAWFR